MSTLKLAIKITKHRLFHTKEISNSHDYTMLIVWANACIKFADILNTSAP
jgi:hypothetical protein